MYIKNVTLLKLFMNISFRIKRNQILMLKNYVNYSIRFQVKKYWDMCCSSVVVETLDKKNVREA